MKTLTIKTINELLDLINEIKCCQLERDLMLAKKRARISLSEEYVNIIIDKPASFYGGEKQKKHELELAVSEYETVTKPLTVLNDKIHDLEDKMILLFLNSEEVRGLIHINNEEIRMLLADISYRNRILNIVHTAINKGLKKVMGE